MAELQVRRPWPDRPELMAPARERAGAPAKRLLLDIGIKGGLRTVCPEGCRAAIGPKANADLT
jgi:hypothetical protein